MHFLDVLPLLSGLAAVADPVPGPKGLVVHEWGVFRVHEDAALANADARAEWDSLPRFMYGNLSGRVLPVNWGVLEIRRRPVIFFHSEQPLALRMRIDFPGGVPGVWWPGTRSPAARGNARPPVGTALEWQLRLKEPPPGLAPQHNTLREVPKGHWVEQMRAVKCEEVFSVFGDGPIDVDREKFVFYDGLFPQGKWLRVRVDKERVSLLSQVKHPVYDVTVIDRATTSRCASGESPGSSRDRKSARCASRKSHARSSAHSGHNPGESTRRRRTVQGRGGVAAGGVQERPAGNGRCDGLLPAAASRVRAPPADDIDAAGRFAGARRVGASFPLRTGLRACASGSWSSSLTTPTSTCAKPRRRSSRAGAGDGRLLATAAQGRNLARGITQDRRATRQLGREKGVAAINSLGWRSPKGAPLA